MLHVAHERSLTWVLGCGRCWCWEAVAERCYSGGRVSRLLIENMPTRRFPQCPGQVYLNRDTIETLYHVLGVKVCTQSQHTCMHVHRDYVCPKTWSMCLDLAEKGCWLCMEMRTREAVYSAVVHASIWPDLCPRCIASSCEAFNAPACGARAAQHICCSMQMRGLLMSACMSHDTSRTSVLCGHGAGDAGHGLPELPGPAAAGGGGAWQHGAGQRGAG